MSLLEDVLLLYSERIMRLGIDTRHVKDYTVLGITLSQLVYL